MTAQSVRRPALWTQGDWNAFFGFGTNILVNMLVLTGLLRFVLKMPDSLVFGRILPALGLMMCLITLYYAWLSYRLAQQTGRDDVCALPSGVSVPHMFVVTFVIMLPISLKTGDPVKAWEAGLVWVFFQSFILMIGGFKLSQMGVLYHGLEVMGGGAILSGLVLGAIGVFIIERKFVEAFAAAGAVLTYFGFMHGEAVGIGGGLGVTPAVALSYAVVAGFLYGSGRMSEATAEPASAKRVSAVPAE